MFDKKILELEGNRKGFNYKGYTCLINRVEFSGHLCGYVLLTENHKFYNHGYDEIENHLTDGVHGGLTFSEHCIGEYLPKGYWIGFDCAHYTDLQPLLNHSFGGSVYRNMSYVEKELKSLVDQLVAL